MIYQKLKQTDSSLLNKMDKKKYFNIIKNYKRMCSSLIANISSYDSWDDEFCRSEVKELYSKLIREFQGIDFTNFTLEELKQFDFQMWDDTTILMPVWALDCLPDGTKLTSIDGNEIIFDKSRGLDKDERFGCTAYGFSISQLRDSAINNIIEND
jgi:hypothetical protein